MLTLLAVVHVLIGLALVLFVLLQDPKGGAMGVFSGGSSSNTFFGSSGASNFLTATTKWLAILFAASCLTLTYLTAKQGTSIMDNVSPGLPKPPPATSTSAPSAPANGAAQGQPGDSSGAAPAAASPSGASSSPTAGAPAAPAAPAASSAPAAATPPAAQPGANQK